jgi:transposase
MYVDKCTATQNGKTYTRYLLRESKREGKKTIKTTILNITPWGEQTCEAIRFALSHQNNLQELNIKPLDIRSITAQLHLQQDKPIGDVWFLQQLATKTGIVAALGDSKEARLALWQIIARTLDQGSRLSAVRLARSRETDFLRLGSFSEKDLYKNLDWIAKNQSRIEKALYKKRHGTKPCKVFLYDVTSSYIEGVDNELANFGYNRDKKRGKMQIVVGLLCDEEGLPVSVEVFEGNTSDVKTFHSQVRKVADRFQVEQVVFVGDRGMIKSAQQKELTEEGFGFITALTRAQIETLIDRGDVRLELFDENVNEVILENGKRYVLRRNPVRAEEIAASRASKLRSLQDFIAKKNEYLRAHGKSRLEVALKHVRQRATILKINGWVECESNTASREIVLRVDEAKLQELSLLDGCYCLTTSVSAAAMSKESVHSRYKDLAMVEQAFRTCKTGHLELRPIYVRKASRTRGHVFVVMLSYLLERSMREAWHGLDRTVEECLLDLSSLCGIRVGVQDREIYMIPKARRELRELFDLGGVSLPSVLPSGAGCVDTERKLPSRRKPR